MNNTTLNTKNIAEYLTAESLNERTFAIGEEIDYLPKTEEEANFCYLESISKDNNKWDITLRIENEFNKHTYTEHYSVQKDSTLELNILQPNLAFFLPPRKVPVVVQVIDLNENSISLQPIKITS